jgi:hypothetical protein
LQVVGWHQTENLNVKMDNYRRQNKNIYVLGLALYLVEKGYFSEVRFIFLVLCHTKNVADCLLSGIPLKKTLPSPDYFQHEHDDGCHETWADHPIWGWLASVQELGQVPELDLQDKDVLGEKVANVW